MKCGSVYRDNKAHGCHLELGHTGPCNAKYEIVRVETPELDDPSEEVLALQSKYDDDMKTEEAL